MNDDEYRERMALALGLHANATWDMVECTTVEMTKQRAAIDRLYEQSRAVRSILEDMQIAMEDAWT